MLSGAPPTLIEVRATVSMPSPLNFPGDLDWTTVPVTPAPLAIATSPCTATARTSVPVNVSPSWAVFVSSVLPILTTILVPAGTTIGGGGGGGSGAGGGAICW